MKPRVNVWCKLFHTRLICAPAKRNRRAGDLWLRGRTQGVGRINWQERLQGSRNSLRSCLPHYWAARISTGQKGSVISRRIARTQRNFEDLSICPADRAEDFPLRRGYTEINRMALTCYSLRRPTVERWPQQFYTVFPLSHIWFSW
jgi:hypothetical protein